MLVFGLAPVLAPVIGGQILRFTSWRGVFGVLAAIGLVLLRLAWFLPETLPPAAAHAVAAAPAAGGLADAGWPTGSTSATRLAVALGNAALITYISALPFIVEDAYHESPQLFSVFFMINAIGLTSMAQLGARLVKRVPVDQGGPRLADRHGRGLRRLPRRGADRAPAAGGAARPAVLLHRLLRQMRPNATAIALAGQGAIAGTASAWLGALPFLLGAFLSPLAGLGGEGAATAAGIMLAHLCLGGLVSQLLITGRDGRAESSYAVGRAAVLGGKTALAGCDYEC